MKHTPQQLKRQAQIKQKFIYLNMISTRLSMRR